LKVSKVKTSRIIPIEKIEDGMILADPILNQFSQVLIPAGTVLSDFHKKFLMRWNISYINIYSNEDDIDFEIEDELIEQATMYVLNKLLWTPSNEIENDIVYVASKHFAQKIKLSNQNQEN